MELDTHELFHCQAYDCNYCDDKLCDVSKADCIARVYILLSKLWTSWRFLKLSEALHVYSNQTFMSTIMSHKKRKAKYQTEMLFRIEKQQFRYKQCFQQKNTLTIDTDDQKFNCDNANGHSQTGNWKKISASWIWKTSHKNKSNEKRLETLFTRRWSNIYLHKLPLIVDLTDIKSSIVLKFNWCTDDFCYFNDAKCRSNISINVSMQSII